MFSFHKPKIYRSNLGCCICKAKSSSSRFTDSKKYENEFEHCFRIKEKRSGEICNACVLLVKRWKKLSPENRSIKHWHHVVDARAGPGTKLTGARRINAGLSNRSAAEQQTSQQQSGRKSANSSRSDLLPLSSSQANNQLAGDGSSANTPTTSAANSSNSKRFSTNKARAIDTNVSTFTFGEPIRRNYMTSEAFCVSSGGLSSLQKAHSSLNSSTFESVIKRFRQRQHQEQLEAERRQLNRRRRQQQQQAAASASASSSTPASAAGAQQQEQQQTATTDDTTSASAKTPVESSPKNLQQLASKVASQADEGQQGRRVKRASESIGALTIDGVRVSTLLDGSLWRKEKVCCGVIFRGLFNEVAISPKLFKPCQCRLNKLKLVEKQAKTEQEEREEEEEEEVKSDNGSFQDSSLRRPRATKSGSISSCDSNTSGTGSMEQPLEESPIAASSKGVKGRQKRQLVAKEQQPRALEGRSLRHLKPSAIATESSTAIYLNTSKQSLHSPSSSSGASSLRLNNGGEDEDELELEEELEEDEEEEEEDEEEEDVLLAVEEEISSSSVDSLAGVEGKNSSVGAMG